MKKSGAMEIARKALLDTLEALNGHHDSLVLVGAQAIYLHTEKFASVVAPATDDADLGVISSRLQNDPEIELALKLRGFTTPLEGQPGQWQTTDGVPVDLITSRSEGNRVQKNARAADLSPHGKNIVRISDGLEACLVDFSDIEIGSMTISDPRKFRLHIASPAAILIAKCFKIYERLGESRPINDKDSFDIYRLLAAVPMLQIDSGLQKIRSVASAHDELVLGLTYFRELFTSSLEAPGILAVGATVRGIGNERTAMASVYSLAKELEKLIDLR